MKIEIADHSSPSEVAQRLVAGRDAHFVRDVLQHLEQALRRKPLERLSELWDLSDADVARMFGVSRQAYAKWQQNAPPADRAPAIAALSEATDLLERHLKRERVPAVVRRRSALTHNQTLIELAEHGEYERLIEAVRSMFDLRRVQP